jgi:hypothetical protein
MTPKDLIRMEVQHRENHVPWGYKFDWKCNPFINTYVENKFWFGAVVFAMLSLTMVHINILGARSLPRGSCNIYNAWWVFGLTSVYEYNVIIGSLNLDPILPQILILDPILPQ